MLADHARAAGARVEERVTVSGAIIDERTGRVVGVHARRGPRARAGHLPRAARRRLRRRRRAHRAQPAASASATTARSGVAVRRYYTSPRSHDDYLETHLELCDRPGPERPTCCPATAGSSAWATGRRTSGSASCHQSNASGVELPRRCCARWCESLPAEWGFTEENAVNDDRRGRPADGLQPHPASTPTACCSSATRAAWSTPFNGEGIAYAMESAALAAGAVVQALARPEGPARERALAGLPGRGARRARPATTASATGSPTRCATRGWCSTPRATGCRGRR